MTFLRGLGGLGRLTAVGLTGLFAGIYYERKFQLPDSDTFKIHAATIFSSKGATDQIVPVPPSSPDKGKDVVDSNFMGSSLPETRVSQIMRFGFPGFDNIRSFDDFVLSYDRRNRVPHWVFEHLNRTSVKYNENVDRSKCEFFEDNSVHHFFRGRNQDYKGSGFDRGHMAAAGNHRIHQQHCEQTFVLSNIAPQVGRGFNRDSWNRLEKHCRDLTKKYANVYVCTGPLYLPQRGPDGKNFVKYQVIGANNVAVPTHFFKIILSEDQTGYLDLESYIMPNEPIDDNAPLTAFHVPLDIIERSAGLLFFDQVDRSVFRLINGRKKFF